MRRFLVLLVVASAAVADAAIVRGPYLQSASHQQLTVRWRSDLATDSRVEFATGESGPWTVVQLPGSRTEHALQLVGLQPDTRYWYRVGDSVAMGASHSFRSSPTPGVSAPLRVWVLGDVGSGFADEMRVRDAFYGWNGSPSADLVLLLGDNAYDSGLDVEYQTRLFEPHAESFHGSPLWPAFGNHDGVSANGVSGTGPYFDSFQLPTGGECGGVASGKEAYYAFDVGDVHFLSIDSHANDKSVGSPMLQWIAADLAHPSVQAATWRIAFWHHPPYSKGSHDSDSEWGMIQMRANVLPLLEAGGVDLVLCGHSHGYERSMLLDGHYGLSSTLDAGMLVDDGDGNGGGDGVYRKPSVCVANGGTVYVVAGSSGKLSQAGNLDHPVMKQSLRSLGSVVLDIDGARLDLRFLDDTGWVRDGFTMLRTDVVTAPLLPASLSVRGNPARERLLLSFDADRPVRARLSVFDLRGRLVAGPLVWMLADGENRHELDLRRLPAGSYRLRLDAGGRSEIRPFLRIP